MEQASETQASNTHKGKAKETNAIYSKGKCGKWTKEYAREYMRNRYRRVHNVDPAKHKRSREEIAEAEQEMVAKFGSEFIKYLEEQKAKHPKRVKAPRYTCNLCGVEFADTEGRHRQHENTVKHKIAAETLQRAEAFNKMKTP